LLEGLATAKQGVKLARDSTLMKPTPARIASSSSGGVLPTPENDAVGIERGGEHAPQLPTDTMSAPAPSLLEPRRRRDYRSL